jgi:glycosyltransferase involved in cell wall biosynthesis
MQMKRWDLVAIHDPELLPAGILRSLLRRATLFDLHEDLPAQIKHKEWLPAWLRAPAAWLAAKLLRLAERCMAITLAEPGYLRLFARPHPVLENYLSSPDLPPPVPASPQPFLAYVGDITRQRGAYLAIEAAAGASCPLLMIGRMAPAELHPQLVARAATAGVDLTLTGPLPHPEAMARVGPALAGLSPLLDVPNYHDSLPTKVLEYLALGLPVLASDLPGTRAVAAGMTGMVFVAPGDTGAWRRAGKRLVDDGELRARARADAGEVRERFAWPAEAALSAYREAVRR